MLAFRRSARWRWRVENPELLLLQINNQQQKLMGYVRLLCYLLPTSTCTRRYARRASVRHAHVCVRRRTQGERCSIAHAIRCHPLATPSTSKQSCSMHFWLGAARASALYLSTAVPSDGTRLPNVISSARSRTRALTSNGPQE